LASDAPGHREQLSTSREESNYLVLSVIRQAQFPTRVVKEAKETRGDPYNGRYTDRDGGEQTDNAGFDDGRLVVVAVPLDLSLVCDTSEYHAGCDGDRNQNRQRDSHSRCGGAEQHQIHDEREERDARIDSKDLVEPLRGCLRMRRRILSLMLIRIARLISRYRLVVPTAGRAEVRRLKGIDAAIRAGRHDNPRAVEPLDYSLLPKFYTPVRKWTICAPLIPTNNSQVA
jgi:hypothetical protein